MWSRNSSISSIKTVILPRFTPHLWSSCNRTHLCISPVSHSCSEHHATADAACLIPAVRLCSVLLLHPAPPYTRQIHMLNSGSPLGATKDKPFSRLCTQYHAVHHNSIYLSTKIAMISSCIDKLEVTKSKDSFCDDLLLFRFRIFQCCNLL